MHVYERFGECKACIFAWLRASDNTLISVSSTLLIGQHTLEKCVKHTLE